MLQENEAVISVLNLTPSPNKELQHKHPSLANKKNVTHHHDNKMKESAFNILSLHRQQPFIFFHPRQQKREERKRLEGRNCPNLFLLQVQNEKYRF
ncbi:hypothetical protein TNCV_1191481 [Trichonephila clavipes]|nr:hypothetical protein TNCV_1191481 [Trichonephila clavipes]